MKWTTEIVTAEDGRVRVNGAVYRHPSLQKGDRVEIRYDYSAEPEEQIARLPVLTAVLSGGIVCQPKRIS